MRRINSEFRTRFMSEEGQEFSNRDYFGYVEMDDFACYVLADSLDEDPISNSAKLVVDSLIRSFSEAPGMGKGKLTHYMEKAHKELLRQRGGMHLKASAMMVVTDYRKVRYCYAGNSRFYLMRNGRYLSRSKDQSLTMNLVEQEKIPLDQAAAHEERNNLYSFLGERGIPQIITSKKQKLENGDIIALLTRGIWEACRDEELLEASGDAKEPEEILNWAEDFILGKQEHAKVDNYTLAVTFVDKIYQSPKKRFTLKRILMVALPVLLAVGILSLTLYLRHRSVKNKEASLTEYMTSGEEYLQYDNYKKASEEYAEARKLAGSLKHKDVEAEADLYLKLSEQIQLADQSMAAEDYQKAQELYLKARDLSSMAGNVGKKYIHAQLELNKGYMEVYDEIEMGIQKEQNGDLIGAAESYQDARDKAASLYYGAGKDEAMKRQAAVEEKLEKASQKEQSAADSAKKEAQAAKEKEEEIKKEEAQKEKESQEAQAELDNQQKANDQKNAIDLENKGNELLAGGEYESAITYYRTAQAIYTRLELPELADAINEKIGAAKAGITAEQDDTQPAESNGKAGPGQTAKS